MTARFWIDGIADVEVPPDDRGLCYADGLFETIAVRDGRCRFLDRHLARLVAGCDRLGIAGLDTACLQDELSIAAALANMATIRLTITRGSGSRGYTPPEDSAARRILALYLESDDPRVSHSGSRPPGNRHPISCMVCETRVATSAALAGMKTLGRQEHVLARAECKRARVTEGLMLDDRGRVVCGTMSNVFLVCEGVLLTPVLDRAGVQGIMRGVVLETAAAAGIATNECTVPRAVLDDADEIFVTNALTGARAIGTLDGHALPFGPVTRKVRRLLVTRGIGECND